MPFSRVRVIPVLIVFSFMIMALSASAATTERIASGLSMPVYLVSPPGDFDRLFVVQQGGTIRIIKNGILLAAPFLDISADISCCGERGLLGLAFHPDYQSNGYFYVDYTEGVNGNTVIARYQVSGDPDIGDAGSATVIATISQPFSNHNGGCLQFGADGMLYVGMGDGGSGNDPLNNAQSPVTLLGKMLRFDVDAPPEYIPIDNPFVGTVDTLPEIWAFGLRNPWRFSFDRQTGDLYIGDVGQSAREEADFQPASSTGGENYGWRCMEGSLCTGNGGCTCFDPDLTAPIHEYSHTDGIAITGGYVYRGCAIPVLEGIYIFADYGSARIWSFRYDGGVLSEFTERTAELAPPPATQTIDAISSFGEDAYGELYILDYGDGEIYKIIPDAVTDCNGNGVPDPCDILSGSSLDGNDNGIPDECEGTCQCGVWGDVNGDDIVNPVDVVYMVNFVYKNQDARIQPPNCPKEAGDVNCDDATNPVDVVFYVNYVYKNVIPFTCDGCP